MVFFSGKNFFLFLLVGFMLVLTVQFSLADEFFSPDLLSENVFNGVKTTNYLGLKEITETEHTCLKVYGAGWKEIAPPICTFDIETENLLGSEVKTKTYKLEGNGENVKVEMYSRAGRELPPPDIP